MGLAEQLRIQWTLRDAPRKPSQANQDFMLKLIEDEQLDGKVDVTFFLRLGEHLEKLCHGDHVAPGNGTSSQPEGRPMHVHRSLIATHPINVPIYTTDAPAPSLASGGEFQLFRHPGNQQIFPHLIFTGSESPPREEVKWVPRGLQFFRPLGAHTLTEDDVEFLAFIETYKQPYDWPQIWQDWKKRHPQARSSEPKNLKRRYTRLHNRLTRTGALRMLRARPVLLARQNDGTYTATVLLVGQTAVGATVNEALTAVERSSGSTAREIW